MIAGPSVRSVTKSLFERYLKIIEEGHPGLHLVGLPKEASIDHLIWMCNLSLENIDGWPEDKLNRWLGYVQGILVVRCIINVQEERDVSRPLFHAAYSQANTLIPGTLERTSTKRVVVFLDNTAYLLESVRRTQEGAISSGLVISGGWRMSLCDNKVYVNDAWPRDYIGSFVYLQEVSIPDDHPGDYNDIILWAREQIGV